jgi:hypothetical protein
MQAWYSQAGSTYQNADRFPAVAAAYPFKNADEKELASMDEPSRIFGRFTTPLTRVVTPPQTPPTQAQLMKVSISYQFLQKDRKYTKCSVKVIIHPEEPEQNLLIRWVTEVRSNDFESHWKQRAVNMSFHADQYEWCRVNELPIRKPREEFDVVAFRDPNRSSIEPPQAGPDRHDDTSGTDTNDAANPPNPVYPEVPQGPTAIAAELGQAPRHTTSTRTSSGKVDATIPVGEHSFGDSVDARITEEALQRIAGH